MSSDAARMLRACRQLHGDCAMVGLGVQAGAGSWRPFAWMSTRAQIKCLHTSLRWVTGGKHAMRHMAQQAAHIHKQCRKYD